MSQTLYPRNITDIQNLLFSNSSRSSIGIVSGGHSYCPIIADTIINMSSFNSINIDVEKEIVKVGSGVLMKDLYLTLLKYGYTFPGGSCPTVSIGGLILGGGISVLMRKYSIACDSLINATAILSNGTIIQVKDDSELLWLTKGAGQGLAIFTDFTLKIYKLPEITYDFELSLQHWNNANKALFLWQEFLQYPPSDNLYLKLKLSYKTMKIVGHFHGPLFTRHLLKENITGYNQNNLVRLPLPCNYLISQCILD